MKPEKFFVVCFKCGNTIWVTDSVWDKEDTDELREDGDTNSIVGVEDDVPVGVYCAKCMAILKPILFSEIKVNMRKKIFKMSKEERINWALGLNITRELEKEKYEKD